jgi:ATP-binding cassette, subfamily B, bacterial RamA/AmfB
VITTVSEAALARSADRLLVAIARRGVWWLVLLGLASVGVTGAEVLLPAAIGRALDVVLTPGGRAGPGHAGTARWLAACGLLAAVIVVCGALSSLAAGASTASGTARLRERLVRHVLGCGTAALRSFSPGDAVSRLIGGAADAGSAPANVVMAVTAAILPVGSVVALGLIDPWLVAAFAAGFPALALVLRALLRDSSEVSLGYQREQGTITARLLEALGGARTIAAAGTRAAEQRRILAPLAGLRAHGDASWRVQGRAAAQGMLIAPALQVVVLAVAGAELARHRITPGELVAASQYAMLAAGIGASTGLVSRLGRARGGARRAAGLLACPRPRSGTRRLPSGPGELRLNGVTVRRGGETVLSDLDLTVPGGVTVAVVGRSGSGKSTLASVAGRLTDPDEGTVTLDGTDLRALSRHALREAVAYAFARPALFGATPLDAIAFGSWRPTAEQVMDAAAASRADGFLLRLPNGVRTPLGDVPMSGGEAQRLGLARAFAHAEPALLLILDDATSSLDTVTEMLVSRALTGRLGGRTRLIVAHRVTTAARADLVAWLDGGTVRALAPHAALWADAGYRALFSGGARLPAVTHPNGTRPDETRPDETRPDETRPYLTPPDGGRPADQLPPATRPHEAWPG